MEQNNSHNDIKQRVMEDLKESLSAYKCLRFGTKVQALSFKSIINTFINDYHNIKMSSTDKKYS